MDVEQRADVEKLSLSSPRGIVGAGENASSCSN